LHHIDQKAIIGNGTSFRIATDEALSAANPGDQYGAFGTASTEFPILRFRRRESHAIATFGLPHAAGWLIN
jgi:hypothetical protein